MSRQQRCLASAIAAARARAAVATRRSRARAAVSSAARRSRARSAVSSATRRSRSGSRARTGTTVVGTRTRSVRAAGILTALDLTITFKEEKMYHG
jgi:hypothetical protein